MIYRGENFSRVRFVVGSFFVHSFKIFEKVNLTGSIFSQVNFDSAFMKFGHNISKMGLKKKLTAEIFEFLIFGRWRGQKPL